MLSLECKVFVLNNGKENLGKFDAKSGKGIFLGYSQSNKAYRVYNKRLFTVEEFVHVTFDESYLRNIKKDISFHDASVSSEDILKDTEKGIDQPEAVKLEEEEDDNPEKDKDESRTKVDDLPLAWMSSKDHSIDKILRDITKFLTTRSKISNFCYHVAFV